MIYFFQTKVACDMVVPNRPFIASQITMQSSRKKNKSPFFDQKWAILAIVKCWQNPCQYSRILYLVSSVDTRGL